MPSNKAAELKQEGWVSDWRSAKHLLKHTKERLLRRATVEIKARSSRWFFPPPKKWRLKSPPRSRRDWPNVSPCGFCWSKITKTLIALLRVCFGGGVIR